MKRYLLLVLLFASVAGYSQLASDVLRYSYLTPGGTARFLGAGGAFGALGAEFSTLSQNPAGLAMYRTDELMLTPALRFAHTDATLDGSGNPTLEESKSHFHFDNLGIVFNTTPKSGRWKTFNVGLGYNQLNNYNQSIYYKGKADSTILFNWFEAAKGAVDNNGNLNPDDLDPFTSGLAYDERINAIYFQNNKLTYDFEGNLGNNLDRSQTLTQSGTMNEMVLSFAGNFDERLMVGATVGVPFVKYRLNGEYRESDPDDVVNYFKDLRYSESLQTDGVGVNFKFGVIYRASQALRLGAAVHSPTWLSLTDDYSTGFGYTYEDANGTSSNDITSPSGNSDYKLVTPWRASLSGAFVFKKYGFLSAEVEWVDYSANRYNFTADMANAGNQEAEQRENSQIQLDFEPKMNVRVGGEAALDNFRLRAGVNLLGKPYAADNGFNMGYSAGVGVRGESFYLDLGYRLRVGQGDVSAYQGWGATVARTDNKVSDILLTVGFKF